MFNRNQTTSTPLLALGMIIIVSARIVPHPPNVTPFLALIILTSRLYSTRVTIGFTLLSLFISDCLLALYQPHAVLGLWSLFTYSGWLMIAIVSQGFHQRASYSLTWVGVASVLFWLWTNFGCWLTGMMYAKTVTGLLTCYTLALPFLAHSLLGDCIWYSVLYYGSRAFLNANSYQKTTT